MGGGHNGRGHYGNPREYMGNYKKGELITKLEGQLLNSTDNYQIGGVKGDSNYECLKDDG